jgi:hypothetical protein
MEAYQSATSASNYINPEVQLANISYNSNNYFASSMSSYVGVASHNDIRYVVSANIFVNAPHHTHYNCYGLRIDVNCEFIEF